jgi:hypothetical protein
MIRNNESWELGEPELNVRGQPVIHDIASKLGCIRPSLDLPYVFPEGAEDFAELHLQLQATGSEMGSENTGGRKQLGDSSRSSPALERTDRVSNSESDHSNFSGDFNRMMWSQQRRTTKALLPVNTPILRQTPLKIAQDSIFDEEATSHSRTSFDTTASMPSPIYTDLQTESPMFRKGSPFSTWSGGDGCFEPAHAIEFTAHYVRQQQLQSMPRSSPLAGQSLSLDGDVLEAMQMHDGLKFADGTIRLNMLDCNAGYNMSD